MPESDRCLMCWAKRVAKRKDVKPDATELVALLKKQEYKCAYTGMPLTPGDGTSLEHKIPSAREGSIEISNLVWVDTGINMMKGPRTLKEFVAKYKDYLKLRPDLPV